jgi:purine nucleoside permease
LQYEFDVRELPSNWTAGYFGQGSKEVGDYPTSIYGTEVFELNLNLREKAMALAIDVKLNDSTAAITYRAKYNYAPANETPTVIPGDSACSDVYYSGHLLGESFGNFTNLITNGTGVYVMTAQVVYLST